MCVVLKLVYMSRSEKENKSGIQNLRSQKKAAHSDSLSLYQNKNPISESLRRTPQQPLP
jgi:hypothetical protein